MNRKKVILGPGCIDCPVKECDTITYRGSRCEVLRDKYNLGDPDKDRSTDNRANLYASSYVSSCQGAGSSGY